jgi:cardiolipin synthase C
VTFGRAAQRAAGTSGAACEQEEAAAVAADLRRVVDSALQGLGGAETGVSLLAHGRDAFAARVASARAAGSSLDVQYYAWHGDVTGRLLAREVLHTGDRGVRVRLLLDDAFAIGSERVLAALDAHPSVEVRLFNGTRWRAFGRLGFVLELLLGSRHLNRRMHNKAWIADGRFAVVGGRNIGDAYFDAAEDFNFRDLDLVVAGRAAEAASAAFERYWRSPLARPAAELSAARDARGGLPALRRDLEAAASEPAARALLAALPADDDHRRHLLDRLVDVAPGSVRVVADPPEKVERGIRTRRLTRRAAGGLAAEIAAALRGARREVLLISPYFVPGAAGLALLRGLAARGVAVSVVTNSLAATDVVAVHGGYARYRRPMLEAGIELFELKRSGDEPTSVFGSRGASLHTKAFVVDDGSVCVGSFNLDPRSARLNTEMAVFVDHPALAQALRREHARLAAPDRSWRVSVERGRLRWTDTDARGLPRALLGEPGASLRRRAVAALAGLLPIESQL